MDAAAVLTRLLQYLSVAVVAGSSLFFVYGVRPQPDEAWPRRLVGAMALAGAIGAAGWLLVQTAGIAGSLAPDQILSVGVDTGFGRAVLARIGLLLAAALLALRTPSPWKLLAALGAAAAASFAWTGHGAADGGLHLAANIAHLVAAVAWVGALPVLAILASGSDAARAAQGLLAFSRIGLIVVGVLVLSGAVNSWFLVGPDGVATLAANPYGRLLIAKLALFALMLALAAANRWALTPALARSGNARRAAIASVAVETTLAATVLLIVSWMGTLPPAAHG